MENITPQVEQALIESRLNYHFIRECMGIHKTSPKILHFVKIRIENYLPCVFVVSFLEPFWKPFLLSFSRF